MSTTIRLASAAAGVAIGYLLATAAYADAPATLPALSGQPGVVTPGGTVLVRGTHCVGTGGQPGIATVTVTGSDGSSATTSVPSVDANGSWGLSVKAPAVEGTLSINATCDLYGQAIGYPGASLTVSATGESAPPEAPAPPPEATETATTEPEPQAPQPGPRPSDEDRDSTGAPSEAVPSGDSTVAADDDAPTSDFDVTGFAVTATALVGAGAAVAYVGRRHR